VPGEVLLRFGERLLAFLCPWTSPGKLLCRLGETLVFWTFWCPAPFVLLLPLDDKLIWVTVFFSESHHHCPCFQEASNNAKDAFWSPGMLWKSRNQSERQQS